MFLGMDPTQEEQSDSLAVLKCDKQGKLPFVNLYSVGCQSPRQIQTNDNGWLVAAACMDKDRVVILELNTVTGEIDNLLLITLYGGNFCWLA